MNEAKTENKKTVSAVGGKDWNVGIKVILTDNAVERISERFGVQDPKRITDVFAQAMKDGLVSAHGQNVLVEFGCLLIVGELEDSVFRVGTVLNLSNGISERIKEMLDNQRPSPWSDCLILFQEGDAQ
jgi:hypothetical protein